MIVILEGINGVGKTTFGRYLEKEHNFIYFKDHAIKELKYLTKYELREKIETTVTMLEALSKKDINIVVDRLHLTEFIYSKYDRRYKYEEFEDVDRRLSEIDNCYLLFFMPIVPIPINLQPHHIFMHHHFDNSLITNKCKVDYKSYDVALDFLGLKKYKCYLASPFFNDEQIAREIKLRMKLRQLDFDVYAPKENGVLNIKSSNDDQEKIFKDNIDAINQCDFVFAITDGKDIGTIWETGYAYAIGKPIVYYAETLGLNPFNVMLARSGVFNNN